MIHVCSYMIGCFHKSGVKQYIITKHLNNSSPCTVWLKTHYTVCLIAPELISLQCTRIVSLQHGTCISESNANAHTSIYTHTRTYIACGEKTAVRSVPRTISPRFVCRHAHTSFRLPLLSYDGLRGLKWSRRYEIVIYHPMPYLSDIV